VDVTGLGYCLDEDYPAIDWDRHAPMADLWLACDERHKSGQPMAGLLGRVTYHLRLNRRWPQIDCLAMVPGLAVSARARAAFESLGVPGMRFLEFRVNCEPFFMFYTDRQIDCLDRERSEIRYFRHSPQRVMQVVGYAFAEDRFWQCDVFTTPELCDGMFFWSQQTFVTGAAKAAIERAGLFGFRFEPLPEPTRRT
jgi:hypothetical protein